MSYRDLEIWQIAREVVVEIHKMTINDLPKHEMFEEGGQIRRSSKSVKSTIVEGYGRRRYKQDFIRFLTYAIASNDETIDHLECLYQVGSIKNEELYSKLCKDYKILGKMIIQFIKAVEKSHRC